MAQLYENTGVQAGKVFWCEQYSGSPTQFVASQGGKFLADRSLELPTHTTVTLGDWICVAVADPSKLSVWTDSGFREYFRRVDSSRLRPAVPETPAEEPVSKVTEVGTLARKIDQLAENMTHNVDAQRARINRIDNKVDTLAFDVKEHIGREPDWEKSFKALEEQILATAKMMDDLAKKDMASMMDRADDFQQKKLMAEIQAMHRSLDGRLLALENSPSQVSFRTGIDYGKLAEVQKELAESIANGLTAIVNAMQQAQQGR